MNTNDIKYCIDNQEYIYKNLEMASKFLPNEISSQMEDLFEDGHIVDVYNYVASVAPEVFNENGIKLSSLKFLCVLYSPELQPELFSQKEFSDILKNIVDIYGDKLCDIMDTNSRDFNINNLNSLLLFDDPKYRDVYISVLEKKLNSVSLLSDATNILKSTNSLVIDKSIISSFINKRNSPELGSNVLDFLEVLPSTILQDGEIPKNMLLKMNNILDGDEKILSYIPNNKLDVEFCKSILNKSEYNLDKVFSYIPEEAKTREIWEIVCDNDPIYINEIPNDNIDLNMSQEEYNSWMENLVLAKVTENPNNSLYIYSILNDEKKTVNLCKKVVDYVSSEGGNFDYNEFLKKTPVSSRTLELYEKLVSKSNNILIDIPTQTFLKDVSQEQYDYWFESLISECIESSNDIKLLKNYIPTEKINEVIWNKLLDKCIKENVQRDVASLSNVSFENLTPQMVDRAMKDIYVTELFYVPCIDKDVDKINNSTKEIYSKWESSFSEEEKRAYRSWYEDIWIKFINESKAYGSVYSVIPHEGITSSINRACIDINPGVIDQIPIPDTQEKVIEYQNLIIYALSKIPNADYDGVKNIMIDTRDILQNIPKEYISSEVIKTAIVKSPIYLNYADPNSENFDEFLDISYKYKLESIGRVELTNIERNLMKKFAINNANLFKTLQLEFLDSKILSVIGESSLEKMTRYIDIQDLVLNISRNDDALKTFGFVLKNFEDDNIFVEPFIERLCKSISEQKNEKYSLELKNLVDKSQFLNLFSKRIDKSDLPFTDYEKVVISYLTLNPSEGKKINNYDDILSFVERKNNELGSVVMNPDSTLIEVKNSYFERVSGLNYDAAVNLVTMFGNDCDELLQSYNNVELKSSKEVEEKKALEIIIKLKSIIKTKNIDDIKNEFTKYVIEEDKEKSFERYLNLATLQTTLKRSYGRDIVNSLSKNTGVLHEEVKEFNAEEYHVINVNGEFNRMVSLLGAYRDTSSIKGEMYDRWNTNQMADNHALCYSLINESNPGTALLDDKKGIIISIDGFVPEAVCAQAPYDLLSDNRYNTVQSLRQQRYFSSENMPNQTRGMYSEYDIEVHDVLSGSNKYQKIQPSSIICFEKVDEESIKASIELSRKLGRTIPIELIDRRVLAENEMFKITKSFNDFKNKEEIEPALVQDIITRFENVRNAHRFSDLSDELVGENLDKENKRAMFNKEYLNEMLSECISSVEQKIINGQIDNGLSSLEEIKEIINKEREKSFLMPTVHEKVAWAGIDTDIDYTLDEIERTYGHKDIKPLKVIDSLKILSQTNSIESESITFNASCGKFDFLSEQMSLEQVLESANLNKVQKSIEEVHNQGFYKNNQNYDEEHISRVILYTDVISKEGNLDEKTRELLTETAKYYSCGRQMDTIENHEQYSAKLAGKELHDKYYSEELGMIQATIELQNLKLNLPTINDKEKEELRESKLSELCSKYNISVENAEVVKKMYYILNDSIELDKTRFVDKAENQLPECVFSINHLNLESSKRMIEFSYTLQDKLAQQKLNELESIAKINFDYEKSQIMNEFFIDKSLDNKRTKDESITQSPIVRLEYMKKKYPELFESYLQESFESNKTKTFEKVQQEMRIKQNTSENSSIVLLDLLKQREMLRQLTEVDQELNDVELISKAM